jgi:glycolate oxidase FAD binding subunit
LTTIDGTEPTAVVTPADVDELAATLAAASRDRKATIISGGGTKLSWGRPPTQVDLLVSTSRLHRLVAHRYGDLTATIEGGARLADVNRELAIHQQWLPLDSAFPDATIGGIVASNDSGPLRHRFGTPRDLLIGVTLALADGRVVKAGGTVVKNVAGYDLGRLVTGSFGGFAAIVTATFKLSPVFAASGTVGVLYRDAEAIGRDAQLLAANQFELTSLDVQATLGASRGEIRMMVRVASSPAATDAQLAAVQRMVNGDAHLITGRAEDDLWRDQVGAPWIGDGSVVRLAWMPASLATVLTALDRIGREHGAALTFTGRTSVGAGMVRIDGPSDAAVAVLNELRRSDAVGNVVVLRAPATVKAQVDVWGAAGDAAPVMRAIKQALDPGGVLNAGRGPV